MVWGVERLKNNEPPSPRAHTRCCTRPATIHPLLKLRTNKYLRQGNPENLHTTKPTSHAFWHTHKSKPLLVPKKPLFHYVRKYDLLALLHTYYEKLAPRRGVKSVIWAAELKCMHTEIGTMWLSTTHRHTWTPTHHRASSTPKTKAAPSIDRSLMERQKRGTRIRAWGVVWLKQWLFVCFESKKHSLDKFPRYIRSFPLEGILSVQSKIYCLKLGRLEGPLPAPSRLPSTALLFGEREVDKTPPIQKHKNLKIVISGVCVVGGVSGSFSWGNQEMEKRMNSSLWSEWGYEIMWNNEF